MRVEVSPINVRDAGEIERNVPAFARVPNGGLIVTRSPLANVHGDLIINLAARHKLPAIYFDRTFVGGGGLISYGPDLVDQYQRAAIMLIASLRVRNRQTCRCSHRRSFSLSSTSRLPGRWASTCRCVSSRLPTRLSSSDRFLLSPILAQRGHQPVRCTCRF